MPGLLEAPGVLAASCSDESLSTSGSVVMSLRGRCCLKAAVSSETPNPRDGLVIRSFASSNVVLLALDALHDREAAISIMQARHLCIG